jgi:hypothetical protein
MSEGFGADGIFVGNVPGVCDGGAHLVQTSGNALPLTGFCFSGSFLAGFFLTGGFLVVVAIRVYHTTRYAVARA